MPNIGTKRFTVCRRCSHAYMQHSPPLYECPVGGKTFQKRINRNAAQSFQDDEVRWLAQVMHKLMCGNREFSIMVTHPAFARLYRKVKVMLARVEEREKADERA